MVFTERHPLAKDAKGFLLIFADFALYWRLVEPLNIKQFRAAEDIL